LFFFGVLQKSEKMRFRAVSKQMFTVYYASEL
jgi:hypothetical protein